jgi:alanine-synthesizing transaminase
MISLRSRLDSAPNALTRALSVRAAAGRAHLDLTLTNPTRAGFPYDEATILRALSDSRALSYEPVAFGIPAAREEIARLWASRGFEVSPSRVALTSSTSEAYSFLFKLLCDPGDAVLVPRPSYPLFEHLARYEGVVPVPYLLDYDGAWHLDVARVRDAITPKTRAIVVVNPNNPTGSYSKKAELSALAGFGLPIISDEVFGAYAFASDPTRAASVLERSDGLVFALDGLSKFAGLPQMKLAWIAVNGQKSLVDEALEGLEMICDTFLSPSLPVQHALGRLLELSAVTRSAILDRVIANRSTLSRLTRGSAVTPLAQEGGWCSVLGLPAIQSEEAWVLGLLERSDILVQPGFFYDFLTEPFVVLSLLTAESEFTDGVSRLVRYVDEAR